MSLVSRFPFRNQKEITRLNNRDVEEEKIAHYSIDIVLGK